MRAPRVDGERCSNDAVERKQSVSDEQTSILDGRRRSGQVAKLSNLEGLISQDAAEAVVHGSTPTTTQYEPACLEARRQIVAELEAAILTFPSADASLDGHLQRATDLVKYILECSTGEATRMHVERIRVLHAEMARLEATEDAAHLVSRIEAASVLFHSANDQAEQAHAVRSVIIAFLRIAANERRRMTRGTNHLDDEQGLGASALADLEVCDVESDEAAAVVMAKRMESARDFVASDHEESLIDVAPPAATAVRNVLERLRPTRKERGRGAYSLGSAASEIAQALGLRTLTRGAYTQTHARRRVDKW